MTSLLGDQIDALTLTIGGLVPAGHELHRRVLFDELYASIPKDPQAKVQIYTAEIVPKGWTNFHCHNGATFFLSRSAKCIAVIIRTIQFRICASGFVLPRRIATTSLTCSRRFDRGRSAKTNSYALTLHWPLHAFESGVAGADVGHH